LKTKALLPEDYRNAIYLDFEGEGKKRDGTIPRPHMAGLFRPNQKGKSGKYACVFFSPLWKVVSNHFHMTAVIEEFTDYFEKLSLELNVTKQYLVFWSIHEEMILKKFLHKNTFKRLAPRLHNLHPIARRYVTRKRGFGTNESAKGKTLEEFFAVLYQKRHPYPPFPLGAAKACRRIDKACLNHKRWTSFSVKQKSYADDLVQYNSGDCKSTWLIAKRIGNFYSQANGVLK
jgi:hypothetical protein